MLGMMGLKIRRMCRVWGSEGRQHQDGRESSCSLGLESEEKVSLGKYSETRLREG